MARRSEGGGSTSCAQALSTVGRRIVVGGSGPCCSGSRPVQRPQRRATKGPPALRMHRSASGDLACDGSSGLPRLACFLVLRSLNGCLSQRRQPRRPQRPRRQDFHFHWSPSTFPTRLPVSASLPVSLPAVNRVRTS